MYVVTGATGNVGREIVNLLAEACEKTTAVSRDPEASFPPGVDVATPADLPLGDAEAIVISLRAVGGSLEALLSQAAGEGVRRAVLLSAITVEYGGGYARFAEEFKAAESAVRASGLDWTFLRCSDFAANSLAWAPQISAMGAVRGAYGEAATSPIHEKDIAEVAVHALLDPPPSNRAFALTGPESLSQLDRARILGVPFIEVSPNQVRDAMLAQGLPEDVPDRMLGYLAACLKEPGPSTTTVQELLGRSRTFAEWAEDHAGSFTPNAA
ncbi:NAD(P)H-binding protein [Actinomadura barringtoniae]|uniref:NAD(P)H-binding protein n=1 Tax=Actinomadura barringtoniae TaxID=1427535 RepID=A0A939PCU5_9ACTN|nr:NAD(P)H-binding protein [Actinomadura barringtoniae]MBO2450255.1 NAD(P)H-binding protein [Actinomadura barringtoniae]